MAILYFVTEEGSNWASMKLTVKKGGNADAVISGAKKSGFKPVTKREFEAFKAQHKGK